MEPARGSFLSHNLRAMLGTRLGVARTAVGAAVILGVLVLATAASGHIERASYWPDPAADTSVSPPAGGKVPEIRNLASSLRKKPPGAPASSARRTRFKKAKRSIRRARKSGYDIRPADHRPLSSKRAKKLRRVNKRLFKRCKFHEIQPAVTASGNNDRVVVMPGVYTEPTARSKPTNDPACDQYEITNDKSQAGAVSYAYQFHCPNDQNLIAVLGRAPAPGRTRSLRSRIATASPTLVPASAATSRSRAPA